ncbi:MAG: ASCH domain-containing protein [Nitrosopumilus sp.]|uniref:ASCH domain-containing protein n=1 Tax=Nitrosopumilus sp. TaxID=2024843 RepID=UPI00247D2A13|nr:ASCH domain-containing protein [Nitrosopumilus sp.]MCV0392006.1 ASCH domain-containing protein [Nitrosopumilus sp.]
MDGLIINEPYANMIINNQKKWELRSRKPPSEKIGTEIGLLSKGHLLGKIIIENSKGPLSIKELKKTKDLHKSDVSFLSPDFSSYAWEIEVAEVFEKPKKYVHPMGARVWVKDVKLVEDYMKNKITYYI